MTTVAIVGAGIGGLCTGILLLEKGYKVHIYEKNTHVGGVLNRVTSPDGEFSFEESASIGINPETYKTFFKNLDLNPDDYFQAIPLKVLYQVYFKAGQPLKLMHHNPGLEKGYTTFVAETTHRYTVARHHLLNRSYLKLSDIVNKKVLWALFKIKPFTTANHYVKKFIKDKNLQRIILFQTFFMGIAPWHLPNIYTAVAANTQVQGIQHIQGGLSEYAKVLRRLFQQKGGELSCQATVEKILFAKDHVKGVYVHHTVKEADVVILNTDYLYAQKTLLQRQIKHDYTLSCSTFIIHLGLSKKYPQLQVHNLIINDSFEKEIQMVFKPLLPQKPSMYLYAPCSIDGSYCKNPNHSVLNVMVRVPHLQRLPIPWDSQTQEQLYLLCLNTLTTLTGLEDLDKHIVYHSFTTPKTFAKCYHYTAGSCFGLGHTFLQSMVFRPQVQDKIYPNLYYVGSSIHPGNGASIVIEGATLTADAITKQYPPHPINNP